MDFAERGAENRVLCRHQKSSDKIFSPSLVMEGDAPTDEGAFDAKRAFLI